MRVQEVKGDCGWGKLTYGSLDCRNSRNRAGLLGSVHWKWFSNESAEVDFWFAYNQPIREQFKFENYPERLAWSFVKVEIQFQWLLLEFTSYHFAHLNYILKIPSATERHRVTKSFFDLSFLWIGTGRSSTTTKIPKFTKKGGATTIMSNSAVTKFKIQIIIHISWNHSFIFSVCESWPMTHGS